MMIRIAARELELFVHNILLKQGASEIEAADVSSHLVTSNLMGHESHGVIRIPTYIDRIKKGEMVLGSSIEIEKETSNSAVINGNWGIGQTVARFAMNVAIGKAKKGVLSCVTVRQCNHIGRLGAYAAMASSQGMVGIVMANLHGTGRCVLPFGGNERRLPTNPISIAFPTGREHDFVLDMSTSVVSEGKIKVKHSSGERLPDGWVVDHDGRPANSADVFYNELCGAILPLGGVAAYKGFGLSLVSDVLSGALSGAGCTNANGQRHGNACFMVVIRIDAFSKMEEFINSVEELIEHVKSSRLAEGVDRIMIPGEPEFLKSQLFMKKGLSLDINTWEALSREGDASGVPMPPLLT